MAKTKKDPARALIEKLLRSHHRELLRKEEGKLAKKSRNVMKRDMKSLNEFFFGGRRLLVDTAKEEEVAELRPVEEPPRKLTVVNKGRNPREPK